MKFSLFPKRSLFVNLLEQMASDAKEASKCLGEFAIKGAFGEKENEKMLAIKLHCNAKFHEINNKLNLSNISSFDREDIQSGIY